MRKEFLQTEGHLNPLAEKILDGTSECSAADVNIQTLLPFLFPLSQHLACTLMKYLVTGTAGFIGSHVAKRLLQRGDTVVGVDNFNSYYDPQQKRSNLKVLEKHEAFEIAVADIRDRHGMQALFQEHSFDAVVHLAAMAGVRNSIVQPAVYFDVNFNGTQTLLELSRVHDVTQFVMASTSSAYGGTRTIPFVESDPCVAPLQPYATSKRAAELMGRTYHEQYGINFTSVRFFTVYGPSGRPDMMPFLWADSILNGRQVPLYEGDFKRDWTFVDDIVSGVVSATDRPLGFEIINLGRGAPESLSHFIKIMESVAGEKANLVGQPAPSTEMLTTFADTTKAKRLLDFDPQVALAEGVERFWNWFVSRQFEMEKTSCKNVVAPPHVTWQAGVAADVTTP